jgi:hypothetical protein
MVKYGRQKSWTLLPRTPASLAFREVFGVERGKQHERLFAHLYRQ